MIKRIPEKDKRIIQSNVSDVLTTFWSSYNLDLVTNRGKIRLYPRLIKTTDSSSVANFGCPAGFEYFNSSIFAAAGSRVFTGSYTTNQLAADTGTPTTLDPNFSDIKTFYTTAGGLNAVALFVTDGNGTNINRRVAAGTWTTPYTSLTTGVPHVMAVLPSTGNIYVTNYSQILKSSDGGSYSSAITINDPDSTYLTWIKASTNRLWVGTVNSLGGKGVIFEYDGASSQFFHTYKLQSAGALAAAIKDDIPYVMDATGRLLVLKASNFVEIARLPLSDKALTNATKQLSVGGAGRFIHHNGMSVVNGRIRMEINNQINDSSGSIDERCPSGIWEYDENIGLYHLGSLSYYNYSGGSISDYGQTRINRAGAISEMRIDVANSANTGQMLIGASYIDSSGSTQSAVWTDDVPDTIQKYGYFVTGKIESNQLLDNWQYIFSKFENFGSSNDKIVIKYRTREVDPSEFNITWTSTITFTTTGDISGYAVGDEIEFTQGTGSPRCVHITQLDKIVVGATTTWTVTVDDTITGATGSGKARFQKWTKIPTEITTLNAETFKRLACVASVTWIQFKVCLLLTGKTDFEELIAVSQVAQLA